MIPDFINGLFECVAGFMILLHVLQLHKDKQVRGLHVVPVVFFTAWGFWNLYYYPHLDQWWSFAGGVFIVITNVIWCLQIRYYLRQERKSLQIIGEMYAEHKVPPRPRPPVRKRNKHPYGCDCEICHTIRRNLPKEE